MKRIIIYGLYILSPFLIGSVIGGCATSKPDYTNIPLTSGSMPYRLNPGIYTDDRGTKHYEKDYRWSISEEDLFKISTEEYLKNVKKTK